MLGMLYQIIATEMDKRSHLPPGEMVDVGGYRLHLYCIGENVAGSPTVILEQGLGGTCPAWAYVQPEIAQATRVCAYDRAGMGWSDLSPEPRDAQHIAEATNAQVKARAQQALSNLDLLPAFVSDALLHYGTGRGDLSHTLRQLCQTAWPVIYHVASLQQVDALAAWGLPKDRVLHLFPGEDSLGQTIRAFDTTMRLYYPTETSMDAALDLIAAGVHVLQSAAHGWFTTGRANTNA
jgi:hypothetical protein